MKTQLKNKVKKLVENGMHIDLAMREVTQDMAVQDIRNYATETDNQNILDGVDRYERIMSEGKNQRMIDRVLRGTKERIEGQLRIEMVYNK